MHRLFAILVVCCCFVPLVNAQDSELRAGNSVAGTLSSEDVISFVFEAKEDFFVRGHVDQITVDVVVRILAPSGDLVGEYDNPARGPEPFQFITEEAGTYRIEVSPFEKAEGNYEVVLLNLEPEATDPKGKVNQRMAAFSGEASPGAAISVWRDGKTVYAKTFGMAILTYGLPFEEDTRTNIGSTSKQFTAFAIMLLVEDGKLSLDDDVREHITELPDMGTTITVRNLLTHTTGYREFLNLLILGGRRLDRGDFIDRAELIDIVQRQPALQNEPGAEWNYNNTAFGLAAVIVERISGQDFPDFMEENVFSPLEMNDTAVRPSPEHMIKNRAEGYTPEAGSLLEKGDLGGAMGAGGIYSTIGDLQKWAENLADPKVGTADIIDQMTTSFVLNNGEETGYGFGLFIDEQNGLVRIHHGGADVAHRSMLVYYPELNAGATAQSNHAGFNSNVAFEIAEWFFPELEEDEIEAVAGDFDPASYNPSEFDEFVGKYALDAAPTFILTFTREDSTLYTQATGQPQLEIRPTSDSTFALVDVDASLTFQRNSEGEVDGMMLHQGGDQHATRIVEDEEPWVPALDDFVGRYFSEELETFYEVVVSDSSLILTHRRVEDQKLTSGAEDYFTSTGGPVSFERDKNGQVIGMYLANGRTRDVRFAKLD